MRLPASTTAKVAGFVAVLTVVFAVAWAAGAQVGPLGSTGDESTDGHAATSAHSDEGATTLPGLAVADRGYRLVLGDTVVGPGTRPVSLTIQGPDGQPVTAFEVEHEKLLHLIVVRRDHTGFQHLHPTLDESTGTWTVDAELTPGQWRVFADFTASDGPALVLGADLLVPGRVPAPDPVQEVRTDDVAGYTVAVDGSLRPGEHSKLTLRVTRDGAPVTDLQPYLGAYGHLVALRDGDLAYLHVHPGGQPGDGQTRPGPEVEFDVEVPSAGRYHLYLDFRHQGVVRTARFVLDAGAGPGHDAAKPAEPPEPSAPDDHEGDHAH